MIPFETVHTWLHNPQNIPTMMQALVPRVPAVIITAPTGTETISIAQY
ncbi:MAG: hypothetical protein ACRD6W_05660 [Nitrososphaerales archaeon]